MKHVLLSLWRLPRNVLIATVRVYQHTLSPDHGPLKTLHPYGFCRHEPTCSMYAKKVLSDRGAIAGIFLTAKRLLSCHPWKSPDEAKIKSILLNHP